MIKTIARTERRAERNFITCYDIRLRNFTRFNDTTYPWRVTLDRLADSDERTATFPTFHSYACSFVRRSPFRVNSPRFGTKFTDDDHGKIVETRVGRNDAIARPVVGAVTGTLAVGGDSQDIDLHERRREVIGSPIIFTRLYVAKIRNIPLAFSSGSLLSSAAQFLSCARLSALDTAA